jgi:hypothetical protein
MNECLYSLKARSLKACQQAGQQLRIDTTTTCNPTLLPLCCKQRHKMPASNPVPPAAYPGNNCICNTNKPLALLIAYKKHWTTQLIRPRRYTRCAGSTAAQNPATPPQRAVTALENRSGAVTARHQPPTACTSQATAHPRPEVCPASALSRPHLPTAGVCCVAYAAFGNTNRWHDNKAHCPSPSTLQCCQHNTNGHNPPTRPWCKAARGKLHSCAERYKEGNMQLCSIRR